MLEAKDTSASALQKKKKKGLHKNFSGEISKKKKRSSQKFFKQSPRKHVFQKIFQALHKILTIQKLVLSSNRGQASFRGLEASRPRPRTSKCVLEDSTSERYIYCFLWQIKSCSFVSLLIIAVRNLKRFFGRCFVTAYELIIILNVD